MLIVYFSPWLISYLSTGVLTEFVLAKSGIDNAQSDTYQVVAWLILCLLIMRCRQASGTLISRDRDMSQALMTSIVLKSDVTLMDIVSTRMLGQFGFLATIFNIFKEQQISVDVVATSEIAVSLTLDPR